MLKTIINILVMMTFIVIVTSCSSARIMLTADIPQDTEIEIHIKTENKTD